MRAYLNVEDWDERCDARNEHGHRQNFGQTFRRDFLRDPEFVRRALLEGLAEAEVGVWALASELARVVTEDNADILISEDDEIPDTPEGKPEPEIRRLVEYWVFFAARFGWVDLARTPEVSMDEGGERLFSLTHAGPAPARSREHRGRRQREEAAQRLVALRRAADLRGRALPRRGGRQRRIPVAPDRRQLADAGLGRAGRRLPGDPRESARRDRFGHGTRP